METHDTQAFVEMEKVPYFDSGRIRSFIRTSLFMIFVGSVSAGCITKHSENEPVENSYNQLNNSPEWDVITQNIREQLIRYCSLKLMVYEYIDSNTDPVRLKEANNDRDRVFQEIKQNFIEAGKLIKNKNHSKQIEKYQQVFKSIQALNNKKETAKFADKLGYDSFE